MVGLLTFLIIEKIFPDHEDDEDEDEEEDCDADDSGYSDDEHCNVSVCLELTSCTCP